MRLKKKVVQVGTSTLLFFMDSVTCHTNPAITDAFKPAKTDTKYINAGVTPLLQFLDTPLNKPFKDSLKDRWEEYTRNGNRKRASYEMVATWASDAWKEVATEEIIVCGFRENRYIEWHRS